MAKFCGAIGFSVMKETSPGVWVQDISEHIYYGDITKQYSYNKQNDKLNNDVELKNNISIVADAYANANLSSIVYVKYMGTKWKVNEIEVQFPRLILSVGGMYNVND